jgi:hypothetical protein
MPSGPSERAVEAAAKAMPHADFGGPRDHSAHMCRALAAAHDPALGEEASVRLGAPLERLRAKADDELEMATLWRERGNHRQDAAECERRAQMLRNLVDDILREHREGRL